MSHSHPVKQICGYCEFFTLGVNGGEMNAHIQSNHPNKDLNKSEKTVILEECADVNCHVNKYEK